MFGNKSSTGGALGKSTSPFSKGGTGGGVFGAKGAQAGGWNDEWAKAYRLPEVDKAKKVEGDGE